MSEVSQFKITKIGPKHSNQYIMLAPILANVRVRKSKFVVRPANFNTNVQGEDHSGPDAAADKLVNALIFQRKGLLNIPAAKRSTKQNDILNAISGHIKPVVM